MTYIIAEAGVNHNGSYATAKRLVDVARECGADAVKFQYFDSEKLWGDNRIAHLELTNTEIRALWQHCEHIGIEFLCTPFDVDGVKFLSKFVTRWKIASGCIDRKPLLRAIAATGLPVILSTGMSTFADIRNALAVLGAAQVTLLHCTSAYPCPIDQVNLRAMHAMKQLARPVGYSDHTEGILASLSAVAMGAEVIEKHLTLDRHMPGPDHRSSIEPHQFKSMVTSIRAIETMLGSPTKDVQPAEMPVFSQWRTND